MIRSKRRAATVAALLTLGTVAAMVPMAGAEDGVDGVEAPEAAEVEAAPAPDTSPRPTDGRLAGAEPTSQIIVAYKSTGAESSESVAARANVAALSEAAGTPLTKVVDSGGGAIVVSLGQARPYDEVASIARRISASPGVLYAEPDAIMQIAAAPTDPLYPQQWHYRFENSNGWGANLPAAWDITKGGAITVAVVDTGLRPAADLAGKLLNGYDMIANPTTGRDGNGRDADETDPGDWNTAGQCGSGSTARPSTWHGTHVAGTIGAVANNGKGGSGVSWGAKILHVRVLGLCGGTVSDIADGIRWAAGVAVPGVPANPTPAKVINLSLGGSGACSTTYQSAINAAVARGAVIAIAAGNNNTSANGFQPGNCANIITVAAGDRTGELASYSNYSTSVVEITAPGGETSPTNSNGVLSTLNSGSTTPGSDNFYQFYQGTSMATPHVAGVLALMKTLAPSATPQQLTQLLLSNTRPFKPGTSCAQFGDCGVGWLDAAKVLQAMAGNPGGGFDNNFNGNAAGWAAVRGAWNLAGGAYYQSAGLANKGASAVQAGTWSTLGYEVRMRRNGPCTGCANRLIVRGKPTALDPTNRWKPSYEFQYTNAGQFSVFKLAANGTATALVPWTNSPAIAPNNWNTLTVLANGASFNFYINGSLVAQGTDNSFPSGRVGFGFFRDAGAGTLQVDSAFGTTAIRTGELSDTLVVGEVLSGGTADMAPTP